MRKISVSILLVLLSLGAVNAQSVQDAYQQSLEKMRASDWQGGLDILSKFVDLKSNKKEASLRKIGPRFGWFWYHRGFCESKLGKFDEAIQSYKVCYEDYPNDPKKPDSLNSYHTYSLYKWAELAFQKKDYKTAQEQYLKFLKEKRSKDKQANKYNKGKLNVELGICYFKQDDFKNGEKYLEDAVENKAKYLTVPSDVFKGFDALVEASIEKKDEKPILDFLEKYRFELVQDIFVTTQYSNNLLGRAAIAVQAGMKTVPGELISLVPNTQVAIDDLKATAARLKGYNSEKAFKDGYNIVSLPKINALIKKLEKDEDSKEPNEARSLALSGFLWSQSGNSQAAYSAYKVLEERFSRVENREQNLFSLILLAQKIGNTEEADKYSRGFLRAFPNSDKIDEVRKFMLLGLYGNKEYAECIKSGISQLSDLEKSKPSKGHDICTFVLGGSYYYTGNFQDALTMLEGHQKDYPESEYHNDVLFLEASTLSRLQRMGSAIKKYDEYLAATEAEPSALYPYALFEKASSHYAIGENEQASDALGSLERRFRKSPIVDSALSLKGNILQAEDKVEEAEAAYVAAFENAKAKGNKPVAGEALNYLVQSLADSSRKGGSKSKEAVQYYDAFWKDYAKDSPHQALVAVSGFSAMKEVGRSEEGLKKMEEVISKVAKLPGQPQLENLINSYSEAFLEVKSVEELKTHYYNFKGIKSEDKEALALLRIALITAYEKEIKEAKKGKDDNEVKQKVNKLNADIKVLFADLKSDFKPSILTPYSLIKIGDYIREKTDNVSEAIVYYDEIIKRKNKEFEKRAQFGLADLYAQSNKAGDTKKAKEYLAQISNGENSSKREKEKAFFRLVELLIEKEEWAEGNAKASEYLKEKSFKNRENRERAVYYIALSYDKMGKKEDALANYVGVYGASLPFIEISAPSVARMMELYWERNKAAITRGDRKVIPGDRQAAYNHGWGYIDITKRNLKKFTKADRSKWEKVQALVKEYEQSGEIVDMAKQKAAQQR